MNPLEIPAIVIRRLPLYLRALELLSAQGQNVTSSQELGNRLGISSTQIRKDLSYFGEFGKQGTGYDTHYLRDQLRHILQVNRKWKVALVGTGSLGLALLRYNSFEERGFPIVTAFDKDPQKIGRLVKKTRILDVSQLQGVIRKQRIQIAIIAVPSNEAQQVADELVAAGVKAILTYASITLRLAPHVRVSYLDPVIGLQSMTYYLTPDQNENT